MTKSIKTSSYSSATLRLKKFVVIGLGMGMTMAVPSLMAQTTTGSIATATTVQGSTINLTTPGGATGPLVTIGAQGSGQVTTIDGYGHMNLGLNGGGSLGVGTGGIQDNGALSVGGNTTLGNTGGSSTTTINGSATTVNSTYVNVNAPGAVTMTTPNLILNGSEKISGNLTVQGYTTLAGPNTTIGAGSSTTDIKGYNTTVSSTYTTISSSQTFITGTKVNLGTSGATVSVAGQTTNLNAVDTKITGNLNASGSVSLAGGSITNPSFSTGSVAMGGGAVVGNGVTNAIQIGAGSNTLANTISIGSNGVNTNVGGDLTVAGSMTSKTANVGNSTTANSVALNVTGAAVVSQNLYTKGLNWAQGGLRVDGTTPSGNAMVVNGTTTMLGNLSMEGNQVTNVANGQVSATSKDAVNGSQLFDTNTTVEANRVTAASATAQVQTNLDNAVAALNAADASAVAEFNSYKTSNDAAVALKADKTQVATDIAAALTSAKAFTETKVGSLSGTITGNALTHTGTTSSATSNGGVDVSAVDATGVALNAANAVQANLNTTVQTLVDNATVAKANNSVQYDQAGTGAITTTGKVTTGDLSVNGAATFAQGADMGNSKVTNVANGEVSATSKDAVNGSQLHNVATTAAAATAQVQTNLNATNARTANITTAGTTTTVTGGLVVTGVASTNGINNNGQKITGVGAGTVSATSTDAVNGAQLNATNNQIAQTNINLAQETYERKAADAVQNTAIADNKKAIQAETARAQAAEAGLQREINAVGAMTMAISAANSSVTFSEDKKTSITMGVGTYGGQQAISAGVGHFISANARISANIAKGNGGKVGAGVGVSWSF